MREMPVGQVRANETVERLQLTDCVEKVLFS